MMKFSKIIDLDSKKKESYLSKEKVECFYLSNNDQSRTERRIEELCEKAQNDYHNEMERAYIEGKDKFEKEALDRSIIYTKRSIENLISVEEKIVFIVENAVERIVGEHSHLELIKKIVFDQIQQLRKDSKAVLKTHPDVVQEVEESIYYSSGVREIIDIFPENNIKDKNNFILETPSGTTNISSSDSIDFFLNSIRENI